MKAILVCFVVAGSLAGMGRAFSGETEATRSEAHLESAPVQRRDHFRISGGWMWRNLDGVRFHSGSRAQNFRLPSMFSEGRQDPMIGSANVYGERMYADGFVKIDAGTDSDGATSSWGYEDASQVDGGLMHFHATGARQTASTGTHFEDAGQWGFDGSGGAPVVQFDWLHDSGPLWSAGLQIQWSFLSLDGNHRGSNFSSIQEGSDYKYHFTDTYDLQGVIPPRAPYQGSGAGNGPLLNNVPSSRSRVETRIGGGQVDFFNEIRESLEVDVNTLSVGPTLNAQFGPAAMQLAAGFVLNIAHWDATHEESLMFSRNGAREIQVTQWRAQDSGTDLLPGFYMQGAVSVPLTERITLIGFGRYEWSKALESTVGPSTFSMELSGWSMGALVGVTF